MLKKTNKKKNLVECDVDSLVEGEQDNHLQMNLSWDYFLIIGLKKSKVGMLAFSNLPPPLKPCTYLQKALANVHKPTVVLVNYTHTNSQP